MNEKYHPTTLKFEKDPNVQIFGRKHILTIFADELFKVKVKHCK